MVSEETDVVVSEETDVVVSEETDVVVSEETDVVVSEETDVADATWCVYTLGINYNTFVYNMFVKVFALLLTTVSNMAAFKYYGSTAPLRSFDPFKFSEDNEESVVQRFREAELKHGRWAMLGASSIPLIESQTHLPAIHAFDELPADFKVLVTGAVLAGEVNSIMRGWKNPFSTQSYFTLLPEYQPGDAGFALNKSVNQEACNKELNNGRLAMIAMVGIFAQELYTGSSILNA